MEWSRSILQEKTFLPRLLMPEDTRVTSATTAAAATATEERIKRCASDWESALQRCFFCHSRRNTAGEIFLRGAATPSRGVVAEFRKRDKLKTVSVAVTVCLHIGVDPPNVVRKRGWQVCTLGHLVQKDSGLDVNTKFIRYYLSRVPPLKLLGSSWIHV